MMESSPFSQKNQWRHPVLFSFLTIIAAIEFIRMSLFLTLLPSFLTNLQFGAIALGAVISANLLADNLSKSATGWMVDTYGPWPVLLSGSVATLFGLIIIFYFYHSIFWLIFASILIGIGVSPTWPAAISGSIRVMGEEKRATMISIISVVWLAGGGLGPVFTGFLIDRRLRLILQRFHLPLIDAYKTGFIIMIAMAVGAVIICILGWINWRNMPHLETQNQERATKDRYHFRHVLYRLWKVKGLIPGMFFQTLSLGMLIPNMLPYAIGRLGLSESQYSLLLLVGGLVVIACMIPVGHWADRFGSRGFLVSGFLLAALSLFIMVRFGNGQNIWWMVGFVGLSYALIQPAWNNLLAGAIPPEQRGVLMGLFMSVEGLGFAVGPLVGGILGASGISGLLKIPPVATPFYFASIFLFIMAVVYLFFSFHQYHLEEL